MGFKNYILHHRISTSTSQPRCRVLNMVRVLRSLGVAAVGFFACLYIALALTNVLKHSDRLSGFLLAFILAPVVGLVLFFVSFFWPVAQKPTAQATSLKRDADHLNSGFTATNQQGAVDQGASSGPTSTGLDPVRSLSSALLAAVIGYASFSGIYSFTVKNDHSGGWFVSLGAEFVAWLLAPIFAIAGFLIAYYVIGLFLRKTATPRLDS
jgi:hypothetical protein